MQDIQVLRMTSHSRYNENMRYGFNKEGLRGVSGGAEEGLCLHPHSERAAEGLFGGPGVGSLPASAAGTAQSLVQEHPTCLRAAQPVRHSCWSPCTQSPCSAPTEAPRGEDCTRQGRTAPYPPLPRPSQLEKACSSEDPARPKRKTAGNTCRIHHRSHDGVCVARLSVFS